LFFTSAGELHQNSSCSFFFQSKWIGIVDNSLSQDWDSYLNSDQNCANSGRDVSPEDFKSKLNTESLQDDDKSTEEYMKLPLNSQERVLSDIESAQESISVVCLCHLLAQSVFCQIESSICLSLLRLQAGDCRCIVFGTNQNFVSQVRDGDLLIITNKHAWTETLYNQLIDSLKDSMLKNFPKRISPNEMLKNKLISTISPNNATLVLSWINQSI
jgi:hypothetical protein